MKPIFILFFIISISTNLFSQTNTGIISDPDGYVNIRESASSQAKVIGKIIDKEEFEYISGDSDWWQVITKDGKNGFIHKSRIKNVSSSVDMNPIHDYGKKFTRILGVDLMNDRLDKVIKMLGKASMRQSGDAAEGISDVCYLFDEAIVIEFNEWEIGNGCVIRKRADKDDVSCGKLKQKISGKGIDVNGLKLGISKNDVLKILGKPKEETQKEWKYDFQGNARDKGDAAPFGNDVEYFWQFLIKVRFENSVVTGFELNPNVQN